MTHANAPLTPEGRRRLAVLIVDQGWSIRRAAERFQVSPATAATWAHRYRAGEPLTDRSSHVHVFFGTGGYAAPPKSSRGLPVQAEAQGVPEGLLAAAKADPDRKQGCNTSGPADDVKIVEAALVKEKLLDAKWAKDGSIGTYTKTAYRK